MPTGSINDKGTKLRNEIKTGELKGNISLEKRSVEALDLGQTRDCAKRE